MATIRKRDRKTGVVYQAIVRTKGAPAVSSVFTRRTEAKAWAAKIESEIRENRYFGFSEAAKRTVGELLDRYANTELSKIADSKNRQRLLDLWKAKIGDMKVIDVTPRRYR